MYILAPNEAAETYPYSIGQLRKDNPQVSFSKNPTEELLASYNTFPVTAAEQPVYDPITQNLSEGTPTLTAGVWTQVWQTVQLPLEQATTNIRSQRNYFLQESDWVVSKSYEIGEPVPANWATYRQALRDVTLQGGFPYSVIWPTKE